MAHGQFGNRNGNENFYMGMVEDGDLKFRSHKDL